MRCEDFSQKRGNYDDESKLWDSSYDRFQVILAKYKTSKFIIRALLYPQVESISLQIRRLHNKYQSLNILGANFMKYYGITKCFHQSNVSTAFRGDLFQSLGSSYCGVSYGLNYNDVMFFQYIDHDITLSKFISLNPRNIKDIIQNIFYCRRVIIL